MLVFASWFGCYHFELYDMCIVDIHNRVRQNSPGIFLGPIKVLLKAKRILNFDKNIQNHVFFHCTHARKVDHRRDINNPAFFHKFVVETLENGKRGRFVYKIRQRWLYPMHCFSHAAPPVPDLRRCGICKDCIRIPAERNEVKPPSTHLLSTKNMHTFFVWCL